MEMQTVVFSRRVGINNLKNILKPSHSLSANRSFVTIFFIQRIATPSIAASVTAVIGIVKKRTVYDMAWLIPCHFVHQLLIASAGG
jgi:hypothetical protein